MSRKLNLFLFVFIFLLSACSTNKNNIDKKLYESSDFNTELSLKYKQYALVSKNNKKRKDYKYFNKKSKKVNKYTDEQLLSMKNNKKVLFSEKERFDIFGYKERLLKLVDTYDIKSVYPIKTANLFFFLDCWNYYAFVADNYSQAMYCRKNFVDSFLSTEREFQQQKNSFYKKDDYSIELTEEEKKFFDRFNNDNIINVYFDFDSYKLNDNAIKEIKNFLKYLSNIHEDYLIEIVAHTDRIGKVLYNNRLAKKRAKSVYNILIKNGVPADLIIINSVGSKEPAVITENKAKNVMNRVVEIKLKKNNNVQQDYLPQPL